MTAEGPDILILGSGVAGLSAAIAAAESGLDVLVLTKASEIDDTNTCLAQGGIVGPGRGDSAELLAQDILRAAGGLGYKKAIEHLAAEAPPLVESFLKEQCGVRFTVDADGRPVLGREGAHSIRRIYHRLDRSGLAIQRALTAKAAGLPNLKIRTESMAVDIITSGHHSQNPQERYRKNRALGAYVLNTATGDVEPILASMTVLATGGVGRLFRHTSNPPVATGDGMAMAYRAGVSIINAEFVQFHPTTLYHRDYPNFLISEALRGEGAQLVTKDGKSFMEHYHPELADLAPRDEVSKAIYQEMENRGDDHVFLDATKIRNLNLAERFPTIHETCLNAGIDMRKDPIPTVPAAHYSCGGVKADLKGLTTLEGLYAVGETACTGVHGANRLASVSLLEGLYTGLSLGRAAPKEIRALKSKLKASIPDWVAPEQEADPAHIHNDLGIVQGLMWNYVGISRTSRRLQRALSDLNYLNHRMDRFYRAARPSRPLVELRNAALAALIIARSAMTNTKSQGCHFLTD